MDPNGSTTQLHSDPLHIQFIYTQISYKRLDTERAWSFIWMLCLLFHLLRTSPRWIPINYCTFTLLLNERNCFNELMYFGEKDSVYTTLDFRLYVKRKIWLVSNFIHGDVCLVFQLIEVKLRLTFDLGKHLRESGVWSGGIFLDRIYEMERKYARTRY